MTVLTRALRRIEQDRHATTVAATDRSAELPVESPAAEPLGMVPVPLEPPMMVSPPATPAAYESLAIVIDAPAALAPVPLEVAPAEPVAEPAERAVPVDAPDESEPCELLSDHVSVNAGELETIPPLVVVHETPDASNLEASNLDEPLQDEPLQDGPLQDGPLQDGPSALGLGTVLLACDLSESNEAGRLLAAGVAIEGRAALSDDVAIVLLGDAAPRHFVETNEPGLYSCGFQLDAEPSLCRRLLVLIDDCRQRFRRTVLVVDGRDESAIALAAARVDEVVLLGEKRLTPELHLLRMENYVRRQAPLIRPRLVVAA